MSFLTFIKSQSNARKVTKFTCFKMNNFYRQICKEITYDLFILFDNDFAFIDKCYHDKWYRQIDKIDNDQYLKRLKLNMFDLSIRVSLFEIIYD